MFQILIGILQTRYFYLKQISVYKVSNPYRYSTNICRFNTCFILTKSFKSLQVFYKLNIVTFAGIMIGSFKSLQVFYKPGKRCPRGRIRASFKSLQVFYKPIRDENMSENASPFQILIGILQTRAEIHVFISCFI